MSNRTDEQRLETLLRLLEWDGYGYWLPDWCVKERPWGAEHTPPPSLDDFRAYIDEKAGE